MLFGGSNLKRQPLRIFTAALLLSTNLVYAQQGPQNLNVSGSLYLPSGLPVTQSSVNFRLEVFNKGLTCLLYSEEYFGQDLSATKGAFDLPLGKGSNPVNYLEGTTALSGKIFENNGVIAGGWANCASGANLASGEERVIRIAYDLGGGYMAMNPEVPIASSAYALVAESLQGKRATDLVQVRDDMAYDLSQANVENVFSSTNYARLQQLLSPSAAIGFGSQRLTNIADPSSAQDATTKNYSDTRLAGQTIDLVDVAAGFGGGKVLTWDQTAAKWVAMAPTIAGAAGGDLSGTYPNPVVANLAIGTSKLADNAVTSAKISTTGLAPNQLVITDNLTGANLKYAVCANNEILKFVVGTGWQCSTVASLSAVVSVNGKSGIVVLNGADLGLGTASMRDVGIGTTNVPELGAGGKLALSTLPDFAGDLSGTYASAFVAGLQGRAVASTAPLANEVLRWNGTLTRWEPSALVDNVGITSLTGDVSASGTGAVAATITNGVITTPKMFATPGANRLVATDATTGATLVPFVCNLNESLQWTASGWTCANPSTAFVGNNVIVDGGNTRGAPIQIGTNDNNAFSFKTNNANRMTILANGSVGIGITAPTSALQVNGNIGSVASDVANSVSVVNTSSSSLRFPSMYVSNYYGVTSGMPTFALYNYGGDSATPAAVSNNHRLGKLDFYGGTGVGTGSLNSASIEVYSRETYSASTGGASMALNTIAIGSSTPAPRIYINGSGDVGVGTITPSRLFSVNGTMNLTPGTLPVAPGAGDIAIDSAAANSLKYHNGSNWVSLAVGGTGDFLANGSVAMTGALRHLAGSASAPGMTFVGDTDNGIFAPAADNIAIATSGSEKLRILANGNVGIGTTAPGAALDVVGRGIFSQLGGTISTPLQIQNPHTSLTQDYGVGFDFRQFGTPIGQIYSAWSGNGSNANAYMGFVTRGSATNSEKMRITADGFVGIGTTTPNRLLSVNGPINIAPAALPGSGIAGDIAIDSAAANSLKYHNGSNWVSLAVGGTGDFRADGSVPMSGQLRHLAGSAAAPGLTFTGDTDNGLFAPATDNVAISTAGSERLRVLANGYVGIGDTAPGAPLTVSSTATDPSAGYFYNSSSIMTVTPSSASSASTYASQFTRAQTSSSNLGTASVVGQETSSFVYNGTGTIGNITGTTSKASSFTGTRQITYAAGVAAAATSETGGLISTAVGLEAKVSQNSGTITNAIGILIPTVTGTNRWSIYAGDGLAPSYFGGSVGIGTTSPVRPLEVVGAMRLTPSSLPGSPVAGDVAIDSAAANTLKFYNGTAWQTVGTGSGAGDFRADGSVPMTGTIKQTAGTAALPGLTFVGDTDNGIYSPAADQWAVSTNGIQRLRVDANGRIGIGDTAGLGMPFNVAGDNGVGLGNRWLGGFYRSTGNYSGVLVGYQANGATDTGGLLYSSDNLSLWTGSGVSASEKLRVSLNGYVGIGTTTPLSNLHVAGSTPSFRLSDNVLPGFSQLTQNGGQMGLTTRAGTGNVLIDLIPDAGDGSSSADVRIFRSTNTTGSKRVQFFRGNNSTALDSQIEVGTAGQTFFAANGGSVGIGTTATNRLLQVAGPIRISATTLPGTPGAGDLAFDSGAGNSLKYHNGTSWVAVGSGGGDFMANGSVPMTGQFRSILGTAAAPGISFVGDTDSGIYSPTADTFAISTGGGEKMRVNAAGNVGIGTTNPSYPLHIANAGPMQTLIESTQGSGGTEFDLSAYGTANQSMLFLNAARGTKASPAFLQTDDTVGYVAASPSQGGSQSARISFGASSNWSSGNTPGFMVFATTPSASGVPIERMRIDATGKVGIGVSATRTLSVAGPIGILPMALPASPVAGDLAFDSAAGNTLKYHNGSAWVSVAGSGAAGFVDGGNSFGANASLGNNDNFGLAVKTNNLTRMTILNDGKIGIGTTNPLYALSVNGTSSSNSFRSVNYSTTNSFYGPNGTAGWGLAFPDSSTITINNGSATAVYLGNNGNVNIGESAPASQTLQVYGSGLALQSSGTSSFANMRLTNSGNHVVDFGMSNGQYAYIQSTHKGNLATTFSLLLNPVGGNVGIGTTNPTRSLSVNGAMNMAPGNLPATPAAGDLAFDIGAGNTLKYHNGAAWVTLVGGGTIANFTSAVGAVAPNATIPVVSLTAMNAATNVDVAFVPKGTGAVLAAVPDNAITGGNKRGTYAVDLQTYRGANTEVASGTAAVLMGGRSNSAGGNYSVVLGGRDHDASGGYALAGGGNNNVASGGYSTSIGGSGNRSSGDYATTLGGLSNQADGFYSVALGAGVTTNALNQIAVGSYNEATAGNATIAVSTNPIFIVGNGSSFSARSNAITVLRNGNLGIGITSPARLLSVNGSINIAPTGLPGSPSAGDLAFDSSDANKLKFHNGSAWQTVGTGTPSQWNNGSGSSINYSAGYVGIGTTNPGQKLSVAGSITVDSAAANVGTVANTLIFGGDGDGEAIGSKRTAGGNNYGLDFYTASQNRLAITLGGNVGVGTTSPQAGLDIATLGANSALILPRDTTAQRPTTTVNGMIRYNTSTNNVEVFAGGIWTSISTAASGASQWSTSSSNIYYNIGSVGIGITTPASLMHVFGSANDTSGDVTIDNFNPGIKFLDRSSGIHDWRVYADGTGATPSKFTIAVDSDATRDDSSYSWTERFVIDPSGNVGIGTTLPSRLLQVAGAMKITPTTAPGTPTAGDIFVDSSGANTLKYYDGGSWVSVGGGSSQWKTNSSDIYYNTGRVGVGITMPLASVHIENASNPTFRMSESGTPAKYTEFTQSGSTLTVEGRTNAGNSAMHFSPRPPAGSNIAEVSLFKNTNTTTKVFNIYNGDGSSTIHSQISPNGATYFAGQGGLVGIGTTTPAALLHVNSASSPSMTITSPSYSYWSLGGSTGAAAFSNLAVAGDAIMTSHSANNSIFTNTNGGRFTFATGTSFTNDTAKMTILANGNVGIGTTAPSEQLEVAGNVKAVAFVSTSDARLKTNVRDVEGLELVNRMHGVRYNWKNDGKPDVGVIAQEMEEVLPEAVVTDAQTGLKAVKYQNLISPVIEAIKELFAMFEAEEVKSEVRDHEISSLKEEVKALKEQNLRLQESEKAFNERLLQLEKNLGGK